MKHILLISAVVLLTLSVVATNADLLDCDEKILPSHSDVHRIGRKVDPGDKVKEVLMSSGCKLKKGASELRYNIKKKAMEWNRNEREGFKKIKEEAKDIHENIDLKEIKKEWNADVRVGFKKVKKEAKHVNDKLDLLEETMRECLKRLKEDAKHVYKNFDLKDIRMFMQRGKKFRAEERSGRTCMRVLRNLRK